MARTPAIGLPLAERRPLLSRSRPGTPFPPHLVGAKSKDAVENALLREVCAGTLTLREAQWIIATDWFKYYRDRSSTEPRVAHQHGTVTASKRRVLRRGQ